MKATTCTLVLLMFAVITPSAQQAGDQKQSSRQQKHPEAKSSDDDLDSFVRKHKARPTSVPACKSLEANSALVEKLFDQSGNPIFDIVDGNGAPLVLSPDNTDSLWNSLIDCSNQTRSESEQTEALRVAAIWERWRAETFAEQRRAARLIRPASCDNLDQLRETAKTITAVAPESASARPIEDYPSTIEALKTCMNDIVTLNKGKPNERYWATVTLLSLRLWEARRAEAALRSTIKERTEQTERLATMDASLTKDCDQIITIAGLTPNGLALYIPPEGQTFMAKNAKNYPRMCLVEDVTAGNLAHSVPHYLLVWTYSEGAFAGFQPVHRVTTAPVSGSGTLTNSYGSLWNFTYTGTLTEINTVEAPYVLQSRTLYLNAYDQKGNLVSNHSITTSSQAGGDPSYAAGYNAGALISLLWNNPSHLIKGVLKDVQKASGH